MATPRDSQRNEQPSTYVVQDRQNKDELVRLTIQARMVAAWMGGVLPEQDDPASLHHVLDVACGTGAWIIEAAQSYPAMSLVGVDISQRMIEHARQQAAANHVEDRTEFHVMDALQGLELPDASFDLVNLRFAVGFLRIWDWPKMINEMLRVTRAGGVVRVTEAEVAPQNSSPALTQLSAMMRHALFSAGHLFKDESTGISANLGPLLAQYGCKQVQTKVYKTEYKAGTPELKLYYEDMMRVFQISRPFIQKWGSPTKNYDELYRRLSDEMLQPDFRLAGDLVTAWGVKPDWQ